MRSSAGTPGSASINVIQVGVYAVATSAVDEQLDSARRAQAGAGRFP